MKKLLYLIGVADGLLGMFFVWNCAGWKSAVTAFLFYTILTVVTFLDINKMEITDSCPLAMGLLGLISVFSMPEISLLPRLLGMLCISIPMLFLAMVISGAFGGGDIKLMAAGGFFLGWKLVILSAVIAVLTAGVYSMLLLLRKKANGKDCFPFGPFLCFGMAIVLPFGQSVIDWYMIG